MYAREQAKQEALTALKKYLDADVTLECLETPPNPKLGDFAYPVFMQAKKMKKNPAELAAELAAKIGPSPLIGKVQSAGPYVNFFLDDKAFGQKVLEEITQMKEAYGRQRSGQGKTLLVDFAQPNTHKEFHVGHIRNAVLGQSIIRLMQTNGYKVIGASYIGDIGAHVAKALWCLEKFHAKEKIAKEDRAKRLGEMYAEATRKVEENEKNKQEVADVQQKLEAGEEPWHKLWKKTRKWSLDEFEQIFKELSVHPDVWYFESEVEGPGKELVQKLLTDGVAKKDAGATVMDLTEDDLGVFLILKSDGSSLYATKDLALALQKEKDYGADRQIFIVDNRQSFYFQQLFAALKHIGFTKQLVHISYDMVNLPEGTMSSRSGNIVTYEMLRDTMVKRLVKETTKRHKHWSEKKVLSVARELASASMKFMMLRQDPQSVITFDMDEALSFDGCTAPYLLYTAARIESIKRHAHKKGALEATLLEHPLEKSLLRMLATYPEAVENAAAEYKVSILAQYVFELCHKINEYYHEVRVVEEHDVPRMRARLGLLDAALQVTQNALGLLTIKTLKEM